MSRSIFSFIQSVLFLMLWLSSMTIYAQKSATIYGKVSAKSSDEPLAGVVVSVRPENSTKTIKFARTSPDGLYKLQFKEMPEKSVIHFSMMGYATTDITIIPNQSQYNIQLEERETILQEVVIKAPNIRQRGDTILYNVSSYANGSDKSLADVLKKMPGIDVSDKGDIKYNGVPINKFYIEGHDMLGGKYALATNNIHYGDVGTVEVMENHQPIKALEDISFSQNPAINIRLKESAKTRVVGTIYAGGGVNPGIWKDELTLMRFTKKLQTLNILKTNNTGDNILNKSSMLFPDSEISQFPKSYKMKDFINVVPDRLADIDQERVKRNQSQAVNINNLWSLGKNTDLSTAFSYGHERLLSNSWLSASYLMPDSTIIIDENETAKTHHHELAADISLLSNSTSHYLQNKLSATFDWNDTDVQMNGTSPNKQTISTPHYRITDDLEFLKRSGNKTHTLNSHNSYQSSPHELYVNRDGNLCHQTIRSRAFYTNTNTSLGFSFKPITLWMKTGIIAMNRTMESKAIGIADTLGSTTNRTSVTYFNIFASPIVELKTNGLNAKIEMPMTLAPYTYKNQLTDNRESCTKFLVSPHLYLQLYLTSRFSISFSGQVVQSAVAEQSLYEGLIMNDYRRMSLGLADFNTDMHKTISLGWSYKKPIQAFFANMNIVRSFTEYRQIASRFYTEDYIISSSLPQKHTGKSWIVQGNISKGLDFMKGLISVTPSYIGIDGQLYQNGALSPFSSKTWFITAKLKSDIKPYGDVSYEVNYSRDEMLMKDTGLKNSTNGFLQRITAHIYINKRLFVTFRGDYYDNKISDKDRKQLLLGDISIAYHLKNGWEFSFETRNVFNQSTYAYTAYSDLITLRKEYAIRPRNIIASIFLHF